MCMCLVCVKLVLIVRLPYYMFVKLQLDQQFNVRFIYKCDHPHHFLVQLLCGKSILLNKVALHTIQMNPLEHFSSSVSK